MYRFASDRPPTRGPLAIAVMRDQSSTEPVAHDRSRDARRYSAYTAFFTRSTSSSTEKELAIR